MKVIQVIDTLNIGGAETLVKDYLLHFPAGVERFVICLGERCGSFYETLLERIRKKNIFISTIRIVMLGGGWKLTKQYI